MQSPQINIFGARNRDLSVLVLALGFLSCAKEPLIIETKPVPVPGVRIDTVYVDREVQVFVPSECDTANILALYCRGEASGEEDGVRWRMAFETVKRQADRANVQLVEIRKKYSVDITQRDRTILYADTAASLLKRELAESKAKEWTFWERLRDLTAAFIGGLIMGIVLRTFAHL